MERRSFWTRHGHACGVRVHRVQRVQRVQRVVVAASPQFLKKGRGWRRGLCRRVVSPQGKRLTMICASLALLHPLLSLTHWIFRSLMLPYKSSSHSANHVRCASTGKRVTRFSGRFASLRIVFPCHPYSGGRVKHRETLSS